MSHNTPHIDDDGVCQCDCKLCALDTAAGVRCTCSDCNVMRCGLHGVPTA